MPNPWVSPYFGSWDQLIAFAVSAALRPLGSPGFVSGGRTVSFSSSDPMPADILRASDLMPASTLVESEPMPARGFPPWSPAVPALVAAVGVQQLAAAVPEGTILPDRTTLRSQLEQSASTSIAQVLDDYCGTPPRMIPWPWPGPPPWVFSIAAELNAIANTAEVAGMRDGLLAVAGQVLQRGFRQGPG
jgi:hypothetical protein